MLLFKKELYSGNVKDLPAVGEKGCNQSLRSRSANEGFKLGGRGPGEGGRLGVLIPAVNLHIRVDSRSTETKTDPGEP